MEYEAVIGLEVHVHLKTKTKAFCGCSTEFGKQPNSQVCPVCLGLPGALPVLNKVAFDYAIKVGFALNCVVQEYTKFDRKHSYYPDLPKNFQISQYDLPISKDGFLDIYLQDKIKRVRIKRAHLEEDAGKLIHSQSQSLVDFNRAGIPLLEIVSEPDINTPIEAYEYLTVLKSIIEYLDVSDCDMEKGSLRCDANVSIRPKGSSGLGTKTELKNMNSFKGVRDALSFEIDRQIGLVSNDENIVQETRLWDAKELKTVTMRAKEEAKDYRYFPEPDLPVFIINQDKIAQISAGIPELPREKILRFVKDYGLSEHDAKIIVFSREYADITEQRVKKYPGKDKKPIVNWSCGALLSEANSRNCPPAELKIPGGDDELVKLVKSVEDGVISNLVAKSVLSESITSGIPASKIIQDKNLLQISDPDSLNVIIQEVIKENPRSANDYKAGKNNALMFLVGQAMKKSNGKANPKMVQELLKDSLGKM